MASRRSTCLLRHQIAQQEFDQTYLILKFCILYCSLLRKIQKKIKMWLNDIMYAKHTHTHTQAHNKIQSLASGYFPSHDSVLVKYVLCLLQRESYVFPI